VFFDTEEERGVYSWVAVNYVHGTMGSEPHKTTGMVELGGNSLQVLFLPLFYACNFCLPRSMKLWK
jgi:Golgi nucleoside diphosphatase